MPNFSTPAVTATYKKVKVNGVTRLTSKVYENGVLIYTNTEKDPSKNVKFSQNFIESRRRYHVRVLDAQLASFATA